MTDRELLEFAAKSAGVRGRFFERTPLDGYPMYSCGIGYQSRSTRPWNPLTDDGDALRLAVKLNLWEVVRKAHRLLGAPDCPDMYAAARHAITIAAAEIGKAMP